MQKKQQTSWCNLFRFMYLGTTPNSPNVQNGPFPASYFFILSFQQLAVNMFITKFEPKISGIGSGRSGN